ncbi:Zerumbone synthase [Nymphaea thermarum]|nr:Zerumbone synthase [Nymphaea thermarum]
MMLEGKVAIVTGGARGIGRTTAELFHQHGAKVIIVDVMDELGQSVCAAQGDPDGFLYSHCDVTVEADVAAAVDLALARFGRLDIMVNNAGVSGGGDPHDIREVDLDGFRRVFAVNVDGVFLGTKHAARAMVPRQRGSIVCLASVASTIGGVGPHPYVASKHAVLGLVRSAAADLGRHGVRVNCVSPYAVGTPLALPFSEGGESSALHDFHRYVGQFANLQGVNLTVSDVALAVLYLAGDESKLEGKVAIVTGGARGIRRTTAELFHQHGAKVIIMDVLDELGQSVCAARGDPVGFLYSQDDVTVEADVAAAVDLALARFGRLDIMVNNAGVSGGNERHDIREMDLDRFRRIFAINVDGVFLGTKHAVRAMVPRQRGSIVCLASVASTIGGVGPHPYVASKHAVLGLVRSTAADLGRHGVRVNCVSPYAVGTPLALPFSEGGESSALHDFHC